MARLYISAVNFCFIGLSLIGSSSCRSEINFDHSVLTNAMLSVAEAKKALESQMVGMMSTKSPINSAPWIKRMIVGNQLLRGRKVSTGGLSLDPDAKKNLTELITSQGYPCEVFTVQTQDGFLLDLHHIPHGRKSGVDVRNSSLNSTNKPIAYLQHGLLSTAADWVMNFADDSLGFILADAGYDVWMGNSRGNTYSRKHIRYSPKEAIFWDWSIDELAKYDTTAFIDFILNKTGQPSLYYIGHSQGTTMAMALFSQRPDYQSKVRLFVGLAPVTNPSHGKSLLLYLSKVPDQVLYVIFGHKDFMPSNFFIKIAVDLMCQDVLTRWVCDNIIFLIVGYDTSNFNQSRLAVYMNHSPAGASAKDMIHYSQLVRESNFTMYNYGSEAANRKHYGQAHPPVYDLRKVTVPTVLLSGANDWLASPEDVKKINSELPNVKHWHEIPKWNHLDFVWGKNAAKLCYKNVLDWLAKF